MRQNHRSLPAGLASVVLASAACGSGAHPTHASATTSGSGGAKGASSVTSSSSAGGAGGASGASGASGNGGGPASSTGALMFDGGPDAPCSGYRGDCAAQGFDCGPVEDGCGNVLDCGTCPTGRTCGAQAPNVCGVACMPKSCAALGFDCGSAEDGCGNSILCGACPAGQTCGLKAPNVCDHACTPKTCAGQGFACGMQSDGCGGVVDCGSCPAGEVCGGVGADGGAMPGVCSTQPCTPRSCADQGFDCGQATDTCGGVVDCGACPSGQVCGATSPNVCDCTGLCKQQTACDGGAGTTVSGTVYAPNGKDPLYNVLVYVPNGGAAPDYGVQPFAPGVACGACGTEVTGSPLVSTNTGVAGSFLLTNVPAGDDVPLVVQTGRWRRKITIPTVTACAATNIDVRMPVKEAEGDPADNIPLMAFATGKADALECVLRKIGIDDSAFSDPAAQGGAGRVRFYTGIKGPGAQYSASTPSATVLLGSDQEIMQYDMIFFPCEGTKSTTEATPVRDQVLLDYVNAGGRLFATHYSYDWLTTSPTFSATADWDAGQGDPKPDPGTGIVNTSFPRGLALSKWLQTVGASTTPGQIQVGTLRHDLDAVVAPSLLWISVQGTSPTWAVPVDYTFDTPVGGAPGSQCGRVLFDDFHVENPPADAGTDAGTEGLTFPSECATGPITPQEKLLEFMIFDLGSCVSPPVCTPRTCQSAGATCGPIGDGCSGVLQCGTCGSNQACVGNACVGCTPLTCADQHFMCGMQGDGCGGTLSCGTCAAGLSCIAGTCESATCMPQTCASQGATCGSVGDGCGAILSCGACSAGEVCGGCAGKPNQCCAPACTPQSCADQHVTCGMATDGCGTTIACGTCPAGQTCGGCGTPNVCCGAG